MPTTDASPIILTEVRFAPLAGDPAFVEISNPSSVAVEMGGVTLRLGATDLVLEGLAGPLAPGAQLLVLFDSLDEIDGAVLHAPSGFDLGPGRGSVQLVDATGAVVDSVAWGDEQPAGVPTGPGGVVPATFEAGATIGRAPGATRAGEPSDWIVNASADVTPGQPNPMSTVDVLLPLSGAIIDANLASLEWYPVPGAATYRVQVSPDPDFATTALDATTADLQTDAGSLDPGEYFWRVQAQAGDGTTSRFSDSSTFELATPTDGRVSARTGGIALVIDAPGNHLAVPILSQRKDTAMLLLELNVEQGAHAWDVDHGTLDPRDKADNKNCALATIAMMNHFYGGDLSQDRIGYEIWKGRQPGGPEWDLNYGGGISGQQTSDGFKFALGDGIEAYEYSSYDGMWQRITTEIDAGRPIAAANSHHGFVITGYEVTGGRRLMSVNDPWRGSYVSDLDRATVPAADFTFWVMPENPVARMQEPSVSIDTDGDGVLDFDETERFKTAADAADSDGDKLPDKQDIVTGVFDARHGYARDPHPGNNGRDYDFDELPTERDPDSDEGGCKDGQEDKDLDGHRTGSETWNFNGDDDDAASCSTGNYNITVENVGLGNRQSEGHYEGEGRVICSKTSRGSWNVSAVYYESDPETGDILGFDISTHPTESSVAVTLTLAKQNVEGPGWFVSWNQAGEQSFSFNVNERARPVVITAIADDFSQHIEITVTCSMLVLP
ncbi:MAG: C39 family peptidase [Chloroflexota bacterium]|nr:C39 family peptidase [Chloroflexota bacterium]